MEETAKIDPRELRAQRIQARLEWPVVVAALLTIPILIIQESHFGEPWGTVASVLNWATWLTFFGEAAVMLAVVPDRRKWARGHLLDLAVVILTPPFAPQGWQNGRLFRLVRLLRVFRVLALRRLLSLEGMKYAAMVALGTIIVGGAVFAGVEQDQGISSWDGIWWAITTVTTVGYGDIVPHSTGGRIIGISIMLVGIGFVALLTAFIADRFINLSVETEAKEDQILAELQAISARLDNLEASVSRLPQEVSEG
ncbi:MAG: ion transporter [Actinobacteria bacterium]|nr:ion transporter [Actinomycetota bacterium]